MNLDVSISIKLAALAGLAALLSACASLTAPQGPRQDNADRLFLKYVEISQRPSVLTADDMTEINRLTGLISTRKDRCEQDKNEAMRKVRTSVTNNYKYGARAEDLVADHAAALAALKQIQAASLSSCDGRGFPQVAI